jgi:peroxiredoxin
MKHLLALLCAFAFLVVPARAEILRAGDAMPDFKALNLEGKSVQFSDLKGQAVFLYFWSRACQTCGNEYDLVEQIAAQNKDAGLRVVGVNTNDSVNTVKYVADQEGFDFEVWMQDPSSAESLRAQLVQWQGLQDEPLLSWAYLIGKDGVIRRFFMGFKEDILETVKTEAFSAEPAVQGMRPGFVMPDFPLLDSSDKGVKISDLRRGNAGVERDVQPTERQGLARGRRELRGNEGQSRRVPATKPRLLRPVVRQRRSGDREPVSQLGRFGRAVEHHHRTRRQGAFVADRVRSRRDGRDGTPNPDPFVTLELHGRMNAQPMLTPTMNTCTFSKAEQGVTCVCVQT